jgi:hypothetical protein
LFLNTTYLVDPDCFLPVQTTLLASQPALLRTTAHAKDDVTRFPIWALVPFALEHDLVALGRSTGHIERELRRVVEDLLAGACGAFPHDDAAASAAFVARYLRLGEHAREDLLLDDAHTTSAAFGT